MVLFAMIVVIFLATIAVVIEMGTVRVTRRRMQSAAQVTAMEVLRERDYDPDGYGQANPNERDHSRRERNRKLAGFVFSPDLLDAPEPGEQGPGPWVELQQVNEPNELNWGQVLVATGHSSPDLQANYSGAVGEGTPLNLRHGDIVTGTFTGHEPGGSIGYGDNPVHREKGDYERVDFEAAEGADIPRADSVLVRLRRTIPNGQPGAPALDRVDDVSSSGWTMPLLFGLGAPFLGVDPNEGYSVRHHGLVLRGTAIAQARPAVRVGVADLDLGPEWHIGAAPITIDRAHWLGDGSFEIDEFGDYSAKLRLRDNYELETLNDDDFVFGFLHLIQASQVGDEVWPGQLPGAGNTASEYLLESYWGVTEAYVPIYYRKLDSDDEVTEYRHLCGFARVKIETFADGNGVPEFDEATQRNFLRITKLRNEMSPGDPWIAPRNASAVFDGTQPAVVFEHATADWNTLISWLLARRDGLIHAPAHVR